jgi:hypothetical protein
MPMFTRSSSVFAVKFTSLLAAVFLAQGGTRGSAQSHPSDEILLPAVVSKNPYKYRGHSGILNTRGFQTTLPDGSLGRTFLGAGNGFQFEKMLDEHTAIYVVRIAGHDGPEEAGEIAVELPNSDPPEPNKLWRVVVTGTEDVMNGFGIPMKIAKLKFEGYYTPPPSKPASIPPIPLQAAQPPMHPSPPPKSSAPSWCNTNGVHILSDTHGINFGPYIGKIVSDLNRNWAPLLPEETLAPLHMKGNTCIRITILPDGNLGAMHLDASNHDDQINRSCWTAITSEGQFPPLPAEFHGSNLEVVIVFQVNMDNKK